MSPHSNFWKDKRVFVTGHTGFKGSWLCMWLHQLGAQVTGYALAPPTDPSLFIQADVDSLVERSVIADVRDLARLQQSLSVASPDVVIHMAAQPLVRESYQNPVSTYETNVMGTVNLLEAVRSCPTVRAVVNVTTDKCYENREWVWGYRENEPMGGFDPYSSSKGCSELVTAAYRNSFFTESRSDSLQAREVASIATARAGNVIGGGDWATDRLICDCVRALLCGEEIEIRNPGAIRPWQHVLEPLSGYLTLAQGLYDEGSKFAEGWNFGPNDADCKTVGWIVERMCELWGSDASYNLSNSVHPHEANMLKLDCSKAMAMLEWQPRWNLAKTLESIVHWTLAYRDGHNMRNMCMKQIADYQQSS